MAFFVPPGIWKQGATDKQSLSVAPQLFRCESGQVFYNTLERHFHDAGCENNQSCLRDNAGGVRAFRRFDCAGAHFF